MKYRLSLLIGCLAVLLGVFTFASCNKKDKNDPESGYSIVGTWKHTEYSEYYGQETTTIRFNEDGTGSMTYSSDEGSSTYNLSYSYNQTTCIGNMMMIYTEPGYGTYYYPMKFKVQWYGANAALIYVADEDYYYGDIDWEEMGVFERQ